IFDSGRFLALGKGGMGKGLSSSGCPFLSDPVFCAEDKGEQKGFFSAFLSLPAGFCTGIYFFSGVWAGNLSECVSGLCRVLLAFDSVVPEQGRFSGILRRS